MENKQTAIEWLEYQFLSPATLYSHDFIMDKLKQAKQIEEEQIIETEKEVYNKFVQIVKEHYKE
jgi:hypothetical protein